jgi:hypothetical protein
VPDEEHALIADPVLQHRLAKYLVLKCFRNSVLENFHSGVAPSSACGDYSDVTVSSPYGTIPWPRVSRLNGEEMKRLMIDVVDRAFSFIQTFLDDTARSQLLLLLAERDPLPQWNQPMCGRARPGPRRLLEKGRSAERPDHSLPATCVASLAYHRRRLTHY